MKKHIVIFSIVLLIFGLTACKKTTVAPESTVDYIQYEGKAYVIGSNLPPKRKPLEMHLQMDTFIMGTKFRTVIDTFFTDLNGNYEYKFKPHKSPQNYSVYALYLSNYSTNDFVRAEEYGIVRKDFKYIAIVPLVLELENYNFSPFDTLFLHEPKGEYISYESPYMVNRIFTSRYWAYDDLDFHFRLKRNNIDSSWVMRLNFQEDTSYYYKIVY